MEIGESDIAARLEGDEFAVVLIGAPASMAIVVGEKLMDALSTPFTMQGTQIGISASIGVASYPEAGNSGQELLRVADEAMYRAKAGGKRQVVAAV